MSGSKISEMDSCLIELEHILSGLMAANYYFEYYTKSIPALMDAEYESLSTGIDRIGPISDILLESMIIQLDKLFEVQSHLGKCLKQINQIKLMQTLKDSWSVIDKNGNKIKKWRNGIVAHSNEQSKSYVSYHKFDPNYLETQQIILSTSRYAVTYLWAVITNILEHFQNAMVIKDKEMVQITRVDKSEFLSKIIINERKFFQEVNGELQKNNFKPVIFRGYENWPIDTVPDKKEQR